MIGEIPPTRSVVEVYAPSMTTYSPDLKALHLLRQNVRALLVKRKESETVLAMWIGFKHRSSLNKFLNSDRAGFQMWRLDRLASFFGLAVYELFQPGITHVTERRISERRGGRDRRVGHSHRAMMSLHESIGPYRRTTSRHADGPSPQAEKLRRLTADYERKVAALLSETEPRGQAPSPGKPRSRSSKGRRAAGGSDAA